MQALEPSLRHGGTLPNRSLDTWQVPVLFGMALLLWLPSPVRAAPPEEIVGAGTLYFSSDGRPRVQAPRVHTHVRMTVTGVVARVDVTQRFQNTSADWVEGLYAFPLPENCAVDRMRMQIGERIIEGKIQEKVQAEQLYQEARANGQRASLVQQHRPNLFRTSVANIGPEQSIDITIGYLQIVTLQQGRYSLRFPLTITPRYLPVGSDVEVPLTMETPVGAVNAFSTSAVDRTALGDVQPLLAQPDERYHSVSFDIELQAGTAVENITSTYHRIRVEDHEAAYQIALTDGRVAPDQDFELAWTPVVHGEPAAVLFREHTAAGDHLLLMLMPPHEKVQLVTPREVIFIIDTSGSMAGESLEQARGALLEALGTLAPTDKFNIIQFNSVHQSLFETPVTASLIDLRRAREYVLGLLSTGGTEMLPALTAAMNTPLAGEYLRQIIFITDGAVGNEDELMQAINTGLGDARLFTVGIGSAPNGFFMRKAAQMGRGTFTYIGATAEVAARMGELIRKVQQPALTNIELQWPSGVQPELAPARIGDLYADEPLVVTARVAREAHGVVQISGTSSRPWARQLPLDAGESRTGISTLWARNTIEDLMDQQAGGRSDAEIREQVLPLALSYGLVTRYTSLIAVDRNPARPPGESLESQRVPNAQPQGSEWSTVAYPSTATPAQLQLLIGMLALACAWAVARWK
jgi:Ca-activated chloride channel family protein